MEVCGASALAWISSISPSLHSSHQPTSVPSSSFYRFVFYVVEIEMISLICLLLLQVCGFRRVRVWCVKTDVNGSAQSLKVN